MTEDKFKLMLEIEDLEQKLLKAGYQQWELDSFRSDAVEILNDGYRPMYLKCLQTTYELLTKYEKELSK